MRLSCRVRLDEALFPSSEISRRLLQSFLLSWDNRGDSPRFRKTAFGCGNVVGFQYALRDSGTVKEGHELLMTGFPIGAVLGAFAATHRGIISAITPIAIPQNRAADLDPAVVHRLATGSFPVFQLDATAYPGNSGSPIYDPATGDVLGVVNMVLVRSTKESALSQPSGITYAVPARHLDALLRRSTLADRK